jgi:hypothetical protein
MIDSQRLNIFNVSVEIEPDKRKYIFLAKKRGQTISTVPLHSRAMR